MPWPPDFPAGRLYVRMPERFVPTESESWERQSEESKKPKASTCFDLLLQHYVIEMSGLGGQSQKRRPTSSIYRGYKEETVNGIF